MLGSFGFGSFVISRLWISAQPIKTRHHLPHTHKKCCRFYASVCVCVCLSGEAHDVNGLIQMAAHQTDFINPNNINMQIERLHSSSLCIPHRRFDSAESFSRSHEALGLAHFPFAFSRIVLTTCPFLLPFRVYYHVFFLYFAFKHISVAFK